MLTADMTNPATEDTVNGVQDFAHLGGTLGNPDTSSQPDLQLRAELVGSEQVVAAGLTAHGVFDMCRKLLAGGADPAAGLECYRAGRLALRVKSIGAGAKLTVRETAADGPRVVAWRAFEHRAVAPPVRSNQMSVHPAPSTGNARRATL